MPTVLRHGPYRFFFYSADGAEPPHIHVERNSFLAKFWLAPPRLQHNGGFGRKEINRLRKLLDDNQEHLMAMWEVYFDA
jgi:hypothetical protein